MTILIGIAGALPGGFGFSAAGVRLDNEWAAHGAATIGAIALLLLCRLTVARRIG